MTTGSLRVRLLLRQSRSLKDKRQVVRSILDRLRNSFNIAATEVDSLDDVKVATIGIATVGREHSDVQRVLQEIAEALRAHPIAEFLDCEMETT